MTQTDRILGAKASQRTILWGDDRQFERPGKLDYEGFWDPGKHNGICKGNRAFFNMRVKDQIVSLSSTSLVAHPVSSPAASHYHQAVSSSPCSSGAASLHRQLGHVHQQTRRWQDLHILILSPSLWPLEPIRHSRMYF